MPTFAAHDDNVVTENCHLQYDDKSRGQKFTYYKQFYHLLRVYEHINNFLTTQNRSKVMLINATKLAYTSGLELVFFLLIFPGGGDKLGVTSRFWSVIKKNFIKQKTENLRE